MAVEAPLLANSTIPEVEKSALQSIITQTFQKLSNLSKLLPSHTIFLFQVLLPIFSNMGECDETSRWLTLSLLIFCASLCFLASFTDSCVDEVGNVIHGFATFNGLWIIDGSLSTSFPSQCCEKYKLKFVDFLHAIMSILVFGAIALFNQSVVDCFFPDPSSRNEHLLAILPVGIGAIGSMFFVLFPTTRHSIGFTVSTATTTTTMTTNKKTRA